MARKKRVVYSVDHQTIKENALGTFRYEFATTLDRLMAENEIDQIKMAKDLHLSTATIHKYRCGKSDPGLSIIRQIAEYLDVDCHYLITGVKAVNALARGATGLCDEFVDFLAIHNRIGGGDAYGTISRINKLYESGGLPKILEEMHLLEMELETVKGLVSRAEDALRDVDMADDDSCDEWGGSYGLDVYEAFRKVRTSRYLAAESLLKSIDEITGYQDVEEAVSKLPNM